MAPLTLRELYRHIVDTSARSPMVTGIELLLLDEPVLKLRVYLGTVTFIEVFFNEATRKASFALIKEQQRIFGADNTRRWHMHPFDNPESHQPCEEMTFEQFFNHIEQHQDQWLEDNPDAR